MQSLATSRDEDRDRREQLIARLRSDFPGYAETCIRIKDKDGRVGPLILNRAQLEIHAKLEEMLVRRGLVRAVILKGRQLGASTYIGARFYRRTTLWGGKRTYILTHEDKATQNLFGMVKLMHDHMPADLAVTATTANANELDFGGIQAGYRVGTAKNVAGGGRSQTIQNFHGSEAAFWPHAETHFSGVYQALPLRPGTEAVLESTANGVGGLFYDQWNLAVRKESDFESIFLPWYWGEDYRRPLDRDFAPGDEELEYQRLHKLDDEQLCWLHFKNIELGGDPGVICGLFHQEYPGTAAEAFQASGADSFIKPGMVLQARRFTAPDDRYSPRVLGVDVARGGDDRTRLLDRKGRACGRLINETMHTDDLWKVADRVALHLTRTPDLVRAFIDITGLGAGVYDILRNNGHAERVAGINFGSAASDEAKYQNRRAEMWARGREWLKDPVGADIPDDDEFQQHLIAPKFRYDANSRLILEPKEAIKKRLKFSPDIGDAWCLTFAEILPMVNPADATGTRSDGWSDQEEPEEIDWMSR